MKSIIVVTYKDSPFINECINSLQGCKYPIHLCINPDKDCPYDPGAFYYAKEHGINTFILLHDSMIMKDLSLFDMAFSFEGNISIGDKFLMCLGKFELDKMPPLPPMPITKRGAVNFEAGYLRSIKPSHTLCPELVDGQNHIEKYGKTRMVLENKYLIKYKSTWTPTMIKERE